MSILNVEQVLFSDAALTAHREMCAKLSDPSSFDVMDMELKKQLRLEAIARAAKLAQSTAPVLETDIPLPRWLTAPEPGSGVHLCGARAALNGM